MMYFALNPSAGRPVADRQVSSVLQRGFVFRNAVFRNLHGGQDDEHHDLPPLGLVIPASDGTSSSAQ
jgi:hypothetical protein